MRSIPRIVQITSCSTLPEVALVERLEGFSVLAPSLRARVAVQLRDPELNARELLRLGERLREVTARLSMTFLVNDRVDLARWLGADGVHLGRRSVQVSDARSFLGEEAMVSVACHSPNEVVQAAEQGADMALLSPIFASPGKGTPIGTEALVRARASLDARGLSIGLVALGGVDAENAKACFQAGAIGVAAIRADLTPLLRSAKPF